MRQFIEAVTGKEMTPQQVGQLFRVVGEHFQKRGIYFYEGDCLNFAVAMHEFLTGLGVQSQVEVLMRSNTDEDGEPIDDDVLSHVVVTIGSESFDSQGRNASYQWEVDFNSVRRSNGEEGEDFWLEPVLEPLSQFLQTANKLHGDMEKLVDKPELRAEIKQVASEVLGAMTQS